MKKKEMQENIDTLKQQNFELSYVNGLKDQQIEILKTALKNNIKPSMGRTIEEECNVEIHIAESEIASK